MSYSPFIQAEWKMQLNGSHIVIAGTAKAINQSLSRSEWAEEPESSAGERWAERCPGTDSERQVAAGKHMESSGEKGRYGVSRCEQRQCSLHSGAAGQAGLETLTWKIASACVRETGLDQRNNYFI